MELFNRFMRNLMILLAMLVFLIYGVPLMYLGYVLVFGNAG